MNSLKLEIIPIKNPLKNTEVSQRKEDSPVLDPEEISSVCRTCMNSNSVMVPILESALQNGMQLVDLLLECASVQINTSDGLPLNICSNCLNEVVRIYIFRKQCCNVEQSLKELLSNTPTFEEESTNNPRASVNNDLVQTVATNHKKKLLQVKHKKKKECKLTTAKTQKPKEILYKCKVCKECFKDRDALLEHRKEAKHPRPRDHKCEVCDKMIINGKLSEHMRTHTKEKPYRCDMCDLAFSFSHNLRRHKMTHTGERPYICEFCGKGFIQSGALQVHLKTHTDPSLLPHKVKEPNESEKFTCTYCERFFRRKGPFLSHLEKHTNVNKKTDDPEQPITEKEIKTEDDFQVNEGDQFYFCEICNRLCKSELLLKTHLLTHEGERSFLCTECGKGFRTNPALQSHIKKHSGVKPYTCKVCFKSFAYVTNFDMHTLIHTGVRPHHCHLCPKTFTQTTHLRYHMRTHSGARPYICSFCGKSFALKGNLTVHVRTHTGETPYVCNVCGKGFHDSSSMKKHRKNHEGDKTIISKNILSDDTLQNYEETINSSNSNEIFEIEIATSSIADFNDENVNNVIKMSNTVLSSSATTL